MLEIGIKSLLTPLLIWPLELLLLFLVLTIYGAMWKGAEDQGRRGWFVALLWSAGLMIGLHGLGYLRQFIAIPWL